MKRHPIIRVSKWAGVGLCVLMLLASTVGWVKGVGYFTERRQVLVMSGGILLDSENTNLARVDNGFYVFDVVSPPQPIWLRVRGFFWFPTVHRGGEALWIPLGLPLVFTATATCLLFWLDRRLRRVPSGHCQACGYDLSGNRSGVCPECGVPILAATGQPAESRPQSQPVAD